MSKEIVDFEEIPDQIKALIEARVFRNYPPKVLAKQYNISVKEVRSILSDYDSYLAHIVSERRLDSKAKYQRMDTLAYKTLKDILNTDHNKDIYTGSGDDKVCIGTEVDVILLKLKKEVAEQILENTGAKDKPVKGGGININTQNNNGTPKPKSDKEIMLEQRKLEIGGILDQCLLIETDAEVIDAKTD